jgi:hypothetical protein
VHCGVYMVEQGKKETILDERSTSSVELKDSSSPEQVMLPSAPVKDEPAVEEAKPLDVRGETKSNEGSDVQISSTSAVAAERDSIEERDEGDFANTRTLSPFQRTQLAASKNKNLRPTGLLRHKLVQGACFLFSIGFLGLCALDLKSAFATPAMIDKSFHLTYPAKRPSLPPNLSYLNDAERGKDGFYRVVESSWNKSNVGLIDKNGNVVVKPQYTTIGDFKDGLAVVSKAKPTPTPLKKLPDTNRTYQSDDLFGFIDKTGKVVIELRYNNARAFRDGVALVSTNDSNSTLINQAGKVLFRAETQHWATDLGGIYAVTEKNGRTGLIDKNGKRLLADEYDGITSFDNRNESYNYERNDDQEAETERFFKISRDGKCGVIDLKGNVIIPPIFHEILSYQNGHAVIGEDEKYGVADSHGKVVIKPTYDFVTAYDDLMAVREGKNWKLINGTGNTVNGAHIDGVLVQNGEHWLTDGRGAVIVGDLCGYIDKAGTMVVKPIYHWANSFKNGFACVYDGKFWHFIDVMGRVPTNLQFTQYTNILSAGTSPVSIAGPLYSFGMGSQVLATNASYDATIKSKKGNTDKDAPDYGE